MSRIIAHDSAILVDKADNTLDIVLNNMGEAINELKENQQSSLEAEVPYGFPKPLPIRFLENNTFVFEEYGKEELVQEEAIKRVREGLPIVCYNGNYPVESSSKWTALSIENSNGQFVVTILKGEDKYTCTLTDPDYEQPML